MKKFTGLFLFLLLILFLTIVPFDDEYPEANMSILHLNIGNDSL